LLQIDEYVIDTLMPDLIGHDRQPSAFVVYLFLWRRAQVEGGAATRIALQDVADLTGLSKRSVQSALRRLARRRLIDVSRESITAIPLYTVLQPWRRHDGRGR
jgi:hypothetical protein